MKVYTERDLFERMFESWPKIKHLSASLEGGRGFKRNVFVFHDSSWKMYNLSNSPVKNTKSLSLGNWTRPSTYYFSTQFHLPAHTFHTGNIFVANDIVKFSAALIRQSWKFQASHFYFFHPKFSFHSRWSSLITARNDVNINSHNYTFLYLSRLNVGTKNLKGMKKKERRNDSSN